jgi:hypothetical protein
MLWKNPTGLSISIACWLIKFPLQNVSYPLDLINLFDKFDFAEGGFQPNNNQKLVYDRFWDESS